MKTLEELIIEASEIADARKKVYNTLKTSIKDVLMPAFVTMMEGYGISKSYFTLKNCPVKGFGGYENPQSEEREYGIGVNADGTICECEYDYDYRDCGRWTISTDDMSEYQILNVGAVELARSILKRMDSLNNKYKSKNEDAQSLIGEIERHS